MTVPSWHGHFVWPELLTNDPGTAIPFYTDVIGWSTEAFDLGPGAPPYTMWVGSQGPLGGTMPLSVAPQPGAPPHWSANVAVVDADATAAKALSLGGKVAYPPVSMPDVGRFAFIEDPQGALLKLFTPTEGHPLHDNAPGELSWSELPTTDHQAAFRFYAELLGWRQLDSFAMGPAGEYLIFGVGERKIGGCFTESRGATDASPSWFHYIEVADLDGALERAKAHGGQVTYGPVEIPGGRMAHLTDPQGVGFGLSG